MADTGLEMLPIDTKKLTIKTIITTSIVFIAVIWILSFFTRDEVLNDQGEKLGTIRKKYGWNNWVSKG